MTNLSRWLVLCASFALGCSGERTPRDERVVDAGAADAGAMQDGAAHDGGDDADDAAVARSDADSRACAVIGQERSCFEADDSLIAIGACRAGTQSCEVSGEFGVWGDCTGQVLPSLEACNDVDDDCDSRVDEDCTGARYTDWSEWSACSGECGAQTASRSRQCVMDGDEVPCDSCGGACTETRSCSACLPSCMPTETGFACATPGEHAIEIPATATEIEIFAWGGGGAGGQGEPAGLGGGGGFIAARWTVAGGGSLHVEIAEGGQAPSGGGGATIVSNPNSGVVVAGGGGGAGSDGCGCRTGAHGGPGGGVSGEAVVFPDGYGSGTGGEGATHTEPGEGGDYIMGRRGTTCGSAGETGAALQGGRGGGRGSLPDRCGGGGTAAGRWRGGRGLSNGYGGGGGSGFYGGGGGGGRYTYFGGGGGGGSSFGDGMIIQLEPGSGVLPGGTTQPEYVEGVGQGGAGVAASGTGGLVVIRWR